MATSTQVETGLDEISDIISGGERELASISAKLLSLRQQLTNIPATYADVIATINGYTPTGPFEELAQDKRAKYAADFVSQRTTIEGLLTAMGVSF